MHTPLRFRPHLRPMVWGGRQLGTELGKPLPTDEPHGESWEISDHASHHSVVAEGPLKGQTLRQVMEAHRVALLREAADAYSTFPWLVKLLDAWDWLSVQVHPPEEHVGRLWPGENSKTEAWFILAAAPTSRVYAGLLPGVTEADLRQALTAGTVAQCLHQFQPRPGDCVFLPAGTVHAVGGGVLMAEVQQTSDATFRLYDWDRLGSDGTPRKLHIEEALACINWKAGPVQPVRVTGYPAPGEQAPRYAVRQPLVHCQYFTLEYVRDMRRFSLGGGRMQVAVVLHGQGVVRNCQSEEGPVRPGDTLLFPADAETVRLLPEVPLGLLLATLPY